MQRKFLLITVQVSQENTVNPFKSLTFIKLGHSDLIKMKKYCCWSLYPVFLLLNFVAMMYGELL